MSDSVLVERRDGVLVMQINRPSARNAINHEVAVGLAAAADELTASPDLVVGVLAGCGGTFCAGMDLKAFLAGEDVEVAGRGLAGICAQPPAKPMIAAVEGWALAGGFELALACDLIVAARDARFGLPEVKRGLVAGGGGPLRLPRRMPAGLAMELALTGDPLSAADASRVGLVNRLVEPGRALDETLALAARIADNGPLAVAAAKELVDGALDRSVVEGFAATRPLVERVNASADAIEGARSFAEKRRPVWQGA